MSWVKLNKQKRIILALLKSGITETLSFSSDVLFGIISSGLWIGILILFFKIIFLNVDTIAGWTWSETLMLLGVYTTIDGLMMSLLVQNLPKLEHDIREGNLDMVLMKPIDAQLFYIFRSVDTTQLLNSLLGVLVVLYASTKSSISLINLLLFLVMIVGGCVLYYSIWFLWTITTFWFPSNFGRTDLFMSVIQVGRYPSSIYKGVGKVVFMAIIPLGLIATPSALAITGKMSLQYFFMTWLLVIVFVCIDRFFWKKGLKKYDGAGR
ncbi:ABC transporter permease [Levilactobacillus humaensis]|uniref:ABC transporter permease n=1 Tax=Levilactobacillus humaensis TaxID=2950375 RepID=UPI0021C4910F|nr:ABC-2 family transporter protein [Levilactobacillus humaensis]